MRRKLSEEKLKENWAPHTLLSIKQSIITQELLVQMSIVDVLLKVGTCQQTDLSVQLLASGFIISYLSKFQIPEVLFKFKTRLTTIVKTDFCNVTDYTIKTNR